MRMADEQSHLIRSAEALFSEYHAPTTSNQRKRDIESQLKSSLSDPAAHWRLWTDILLLTPNHFLINHCLNLLNDFIANFWSSWATVDQKNYIKERLLHYLTAKSLPLPSFLSTKLLKLLVDIGRNDWPHFYPTFFQNIQGLIADPGLALVGWKMLRLVCEEFVAPKEDVRVSRKEELGRLLAGKVPVVFGLMETVLRPVAEGVHGGNAGRVEKEAVRCCNEALQIFNQMTTWMPPGTAIPAALMQMLFFFAGCDLDNAQLFELGAGSMACLVELAGKVCTTPEVEKNLWTIYEFAYVRLDTVNQQLDGWSELSDTASEYLSQFIELLRPLLTTHLQRFEAHANFPTLTLLSRFFTFTFRLPAADLFLLCTDIWNDFLDRLLAVASARASAARQNILTSYSEPILALVDCLLQRVQSDGKRQETELDEPEEFDLKCVGLVVKAGEIVPNEVLERLVRRFRELKGMFLGLRSVVRTETSGSETSVTLPLTDDAQLQQLHSLLRDLTVVSQATASHCGLLTGDLYSAYAARVLEVVQGLVECQGLLNGPLAGLRAPAPLPADLAQLHAALYSALESTVPWLAHFCSTSGAGDLTGFISTLLSTCLEPVFHPTNSPNATAGCKTARTLTKCLRHIPLSPLEPVEALYRLFVTGDVGQWDMPAQGRLHALCTLSNVYSLPVVGVSEEQQGWEGRVERHATLVRAVGERFCRVGREMNGQPSPQMVEVVRETLGTLSGMLLYCVDDPKKSKQIMLQSITPLLQATVGMLGMVQRIPELRSALLRFVLTVFTALKSAFPADLTSPLSDLFEGLFEQFLDPDELLRSLQSSDPQQIDSLSTCFDLLQLVVGDPAYKSYLPVVIGLCHIVCPALETLRDVRIEFRLASYELLLSVLQQHWTWFFQRERLVESSNGEGVDVSVKEEKVMTKDFVVIMHCLGAALVQPEISLTQTVLRGLNQLHLTRQLYDKAPFKELLRPDFLTALLGMLVHKDKTLLAEDMYTAVYCMTRPTDNGAWFFEAFLPEFLGKWPGLEERQREMLGGLFVMMDDQVRFTEQLQGLVSEMRCFLMYNSLTRM